jgi:coenzyme PQQ precursor peptide PqqA
LRTVEIRKAWRPELRIRRSDLPHEGIALPLAEALYWRRIGCKISMWRRWITDYRGELPMTWTTPTLVEICIGLEINGYLPAEF